MHYHQDMIIHGTAFITLVSSNSFEKITFVYLDRHMVYSKIFNFFSFFNMVIPEEENKKSDRYILVQQGAYVRLHQRIFITYRKW